MTNIDPLKKFEAFTRIWDLAMSEMERESDPEIKAGLEQIAGSIRASADKFMAANPAVFVIVD